MGWFDRDMNLVSEDRSLTVCVGWEDLDLYALNTEDPDFSGTSFTDTEIDLGERFEDLEWKIRPYGCHDPELEGEGRSVSYTFEEPGWYDIYGTDPSGRHSEYRSLFVDGDALREFSWMHDGQEYSFDIRIDYEDLLEYHRMEDRDGRHCIVSPENKDHVHEKHFVTWTDQYVQLLAERLNAMTPCMNDLERADFTLSFLDCVKYKSDETSKDVQDYWSFPLETLYEMEGDSEDTSILYAALMKAMGYDTALVMFPNHTMSAVKLNCGDPELEYFRDNVGSCYYYVDCTPGNMCLGRLPDVVDIREEIHVFV